MVTPVVFYNIGLKYLQKLKNIGAELNIKKEMILSPRITILSLYNKKEEFIEVYKSKKTPLL